MSSDPGSSSDQQNLLAFAVEAARLLSDRRCEDVLLLDVRGLSQVCDYMIIASGTSEKQMKSVAAELEDLGGELGQPVFRSNRDTGNTWIVVDFVNVVAHLFEPTHRSYYELERLWSDSRPVRWERSDARGNGASAATPRRGDEAGDE